jgi:hypothetical protein
MGSWLNVWCVYMYVCVFAISDCSIDVKSLILRGRGPIRVMMCGYDLICCGWEEASC